MYGLKHCQVCGVTSGTFVWDWAYPEDGAWCTNCYEISARKSDPIMNPIQRRIIMNLTDLKNKLKKAWNENPDRIISIVTAGATVLTAVSKVNELNASAKSKRAYARRMNK